MSILTRSLLFNFSSRTSPAPTGTSPAPTSLVGCKHLLVFFLRLLESNLIFLQTSHNLLRQYLFTHCFIFDFPPELPSFLTHLSDSKVGMLLLNGRPILSEPLEEWSERFLGSVGIFLLLLLLAAFISSGCGLLIGRKKIIS